jgi:aldose sugar dehydrogenase
MKKPYVIAIVAILLGLLGYGGYLTLKNRVFAPTDQENVVDEKVAEDYTTEGDGVSETAAIEVVAENLQIPWEIAFLPSSEMLITERVGSLVKIGDDPSTSSEQSREKIVIQGVEHRGEGGLLGMALHPNFEQNSWIYLYLTTKTDGVLTNRVERYKFSANALSERTVIIESIPGASNHDGGRIKFGPDELLYITTGDAGNADSAQNLDTLSGKVLRLRDDGSVPSDNPFGTAVYSYGHRNPQGLAWDDSEELWVTEHGRSGISSGLDELNHITKGANYGWPDSQGNTVLSGTVGPARHSGPNITWAPAGAVNWGGSIFFTGLRGESLYEAQIKNGGVLSFKTHFYRKFGRLRAIVLGPDEMLYISTSNTDGRGDIQKGDDKIIRVNPEIFR